MPCWFLLGADFAFALPSVLIFLSQVLIASAAVLFWSADPECFPVTVLGTWELVEKWRAFHSESMLLWSLPAIAALN